MEESIKSINPYSGYLVAEYDLHTEEQLNEMLDNGQEAYRFWARRSVEHRAAFLYKIADRLEARKEELAELAALEMGKPVDQGCAELEKCAWLCRHYADEGTGYLAPEQVEISKGSFEKGEIRYKPLGLILAIMPWNYPYWQVLRFLAPTILAGNAAILKHASNVTGCALKILDIIEEAGVPKNVFQVLKAKGKTASEMIADNRIQGVSLTGSENAGRAVGAAAGKAIKPCVLELGGNNASIVCSDADVADAVAKIFQARFGNNGQSCIAAKRVFLHESIAKSFLAEMEDKIAAAKRGNPLKKGVFMSAMAKEEFAEELEKQVLDSIAKGAKAVVDIAREKAKFAPALVKDMATDHRIFREETFGPVLCVATFQNDDEAIALANDSKFALGASVFTTNPQKAEKFIAELDEPAIFVNEIVQSHPQLPFGGAKTSGIGREMGKFGAHAFTNIQTVVNPIF